MSSTTRLSVPEGTNRLSNPSLRRRPRAWRCSLWIASLLGVLGMPGGVIAEENNADRPRATLNQLFGITPVLQLDQNLRADVAPNPDILKLLLEYQARDGSAQATWFRGHIDAFSAAPKTTIPDYARLVLDRFGVPASPRGIQKFGAVQTPKPALDWDKLPSLPLPLLTEPRAEEAGEPNAADKPVGSYEGNVTPLPRPTLPPSGEPPPTPPALSVLARYVFQTFLYQNRVLFEIPDADLRLGLPGLRLVSFNAGRYNMRLTYQQTAGPGVLHSGKTIVLLDPNWNVIGISRILLSEAKIKDILGRSGEPTLTRDQAVGRVLAMVQKVFGTTRVPQVTEATLGLESLRGLYSWKVRVVRADAYYSDFVVSMDAQTGALLNVADIVDRYTDALVSRWGYSSGDLTAPIRYVANSFYTRDNDTLVHDFFHVVNDNRNNGDPLHSCGETPQQTQTESAAYGTTSGSNYIRPSIRSDRNFSLWWPSEGSGTFGEAHVYYWGRWFMQWMKPALSALGVLPSSASNYPRALIIVNACEDGVGWHSSSFPVTTLNNVAEGINTIRLPERCRSTNANCAPGDYASSNSDNSYTFEGNAGYSVPGVVHHELNHFVMKRYFGIGAGLDCAAGEQLKYLHEGAAGRSLPQAYWHHYYGSGYAPTNQWRNYRHNQVAGRPHIDNASLNTLSDFYCADDPSAYSAGSVVHQAMWKFYHGIAVNGSTQSGIPRVSTDTDFLTLYYWAADLVSASTYQDRYEMANRVMEIMENHSALSSSGKQQWCDVWGVHELDNFIVGGYCS